MSAQFSALNPKGSYLSLEKEKEPFCTVFTYSVKRASEIRKFHVAIVQRLLKNVQKSLMHLQTCCFTNINLLLFCPSRCRRCRCCLSFLLLWSKHFATMVTWRHTSPLYWPTIYRARAAVMSTITSNNNCKMRKTGLGTAWITWS